MIAAALGLLLQSSLSPEPMICSLSFEFERGRVSPTSVQCPAGPAREDAETAIRQHVEGIGRISVPYYAADWGGNVRLWVLSADTDEGVEWYVQSIPLFIRFGRYPEQEIRRGTAASCAVSYNVIDGEVEDAESFCHASGSARSFNRTMRVATRTWRYSNGLPLFCMESGMTYQLEGGQRAPAMPDAPDCQPPDNYQDYYPEGMRDYAYLMARGARPPTRTYAPSNSAADDEVKPGMSE